MKKLTYDALLPMLYSHISQNIEIPVLIDFIETEFGINGVEYEEDGIFSVSEDAFNLFTSINKEDIGNIVNDVMKGWQEIERLKSSS